MNKKIYLQKDLCTKWGSPYTPVNPFYKMGVSNNIRDNIYPINGLRHYPSRGTSGWYIWLGENIKLNEDFFIPIHVGHITEWNSDVEIYLALAPGWRFLIAPDYEDVWFDSSLLIC